MDLWHDLIDFSIDKPYFVHVLLHNIGTHVDPRILINKIGKSIVHMPDKTTNLVKLTLKIPRKPMEPLETQKNSKEPIFG